MRDGWNVKLTRGGYRQRRESLSPHFDLPPSTNNSTRYPRRRNMKTRIFTSLIFLACAVFLTACPQQTSINRINGDPARYRGKEVLLVGTVTNSFGALGQGAYELSDETGKIWVLTQRGAPSRGARVGAVGRYINGAVWAGRNYGSALQETDRKVR